jgi:ketosteroid isomerase-like protein
VATSTGKSTISVFDRNRTEEAKMIRKVPLLLIGALSLPSIAPTLAQSDQWELKAGASASRVERGFEKADNVATWKKNREVQKRFQNAVYARDYAKLRAQIAELVDPDFELVEPSGLPYGGTYKGVEGFIQFWETAPKYFKTSVHEFRHSFITDDPNRIVQEIFLRGTVVATGEEYEDRFVFRNGKILSISPFFFNLPPVKAR